jgi:ribosomal-protein-alanine N-acetyltransferase
LRDIKAEDRAEVFSLYSNPEVTRFCDMVTLTDPLQAEMIIRVLQADWEKDTGARWAITRQGSPGLIGICGVGWHRHNYSALLSYDLNQEFWNQGIMTEALKALAEYAFGQAWLNRITAITILDNPGSVKVLRHLGFQEEGILREWGFWRGAFKDVRCLSLLRKDMAAGRGVCSSQIRADVPRPANAPNPPRGCRDTASVHAPRAFRVSSGVAGHPQG